MPNLLNMYACRYVAIKNTNEVRIYTREGCVCGTINFDACTSAYKQADSFSWQSWSCWERNYNGLGYANG